MAVAPRSVVPRGFDVSPDTGPMNVRPATETRVPVAARPATIVVGRGGEAGRASVVGAYRPVAGGGFRPPQSGGRPPAVPRGGWPRPHRPGFLVANPRYRGGAWGWNAGNAWTGYSDYWGDGFWGPFALGSLAGAFVVASGESSEPYYQVTADSPGAQLLANYDLRQTPCGSPDLVVLDGPNSGTICAYPNGTVSPGTYDVGESTLSLTSGPA
jgi:hypothetical protein